MSPEQLQEIVIASKIERLKSNPTKQMLENECPNFYQPLFTWTVFVSRISDEEYVIFKTKLLKIQYQAQNHEERLAELEIISD